jgi:hypothetical protein
VFCDRTPVLIEREREREKNTFFESGKTQSIASLLLLFVCVIEFSSRV